jgi:cytochrome c
MMRSKSYCFWRERLAVAAQLLILSCGHSLAQDTHSPFTQAEVVAGHAGFHAYCAGCHGDQLQGGGSQGGGDAPQLTGPNFRQDWSKYTIRILYQYVSKTMPDGLAGDLSPKTYRDILSFLLAANGARPGPQPFDPESGIKIGDIADASLVTAVTNAPIQAQVGAMH